MTSKTREPAVSLPTLLVSCVIHQQSHNYSPQIPAINAAQGSKTPAPAVTVTRPTSTPLQRADKSHVLSLVVNQWQKASLTTIIITSQSHFLLTRLSPEYANHER